MRDSRVAAAAVAVLLLIAGCGNESRSDAAAEKSQLEEEAAQERQEALKERQARQTAVYTECRQAAGPLNDKLVALNSRLSVGLAMDKYSDEVGSAKVAYDRFVRDARARGGVSQQCLAKVGIPLESALGAYIKANDTWNDCYQDTYCTMDEGSPALTRTQAAWSRAGKLVNRADRALSNLQP